MFLFNIFFLTFWAMQVQSSPSVPTVTKLLNDGNRIPAIALGTFGPIFKPDVITKAVEYAIKVGYRHFDTAAYYRNEVFVGEGIAKAIRKGYATRDELFITTKLNLLVDTGKGVKPSLQNSLSNLNLTYVDLFLIHSPLNAKDLSQNNIVDIWRGMEEVKKLGLARSIGVANFESVHINKILANNEIPPAVNQIEINPTFTNLDLVAYCQSLNITVSAYAPLGFMVPREFRPDVNPRPPPSLNNTLLNTLAKKYHKTPVQINLRYLLERDLVILPKSYTLSHIKRNIDVFDFTLTKAEVLQINEFNREEKAYVFTAEILDAITKYFSGDDFETSLNLI